MKKELQQAIKAHGAEVVYKASCQAMEGNYTALQNLGVPATTLGHAFVAQSESHKGMTPGQRASEQMTVNGELTRIIKTVAQRVDAHDARLVQQGGRRLNGIRLSPDAAAVLAALEAKGETATAVFNRLLLQ